MTPAPVLIQNGYTNVYSPFDNLPWHEQPQFINSVANIRRCLDCSNIITELLNANDRYKNGQYSQYKSSLKKDNALRLLEDTRTKLADGDWDAATALLEKENAALLYVLVPAYENHLTKGMPQLMAELKVFIRKHNIA